MVFCVIHHNANGHVLSFRYSASSHHPILVLLCAVSNISLRLLMKMRLDALRLTPPHASSIALPYKIPPRMTLLLPDFCLLFPPILLGADIHHVLRREKGEQQ